MRNDRNILAGLAGADLTRALASQENAQGIVEGRRRAAAALVAPRGPKRALVARWSAVMHPELATPPETWGPTVDAVNYFRGEGPPTSIPPGAKLRDVYVDTLTDLAYILTEDML